MKMPTIKNYKHLSQEDFLQTCTKSRNTYLKGQLTENISDVIYFGDALWIFHMILVLFSKQERNLKIHHVVPEPRSYLLLVMDLLSAIPVELLVTNNRLKCFLSLNRPFKILYVKYVFDFHTSLLMIHWFIYVFQFLYLIIYIIFFSTFMLAITINIYTPNLFKAEVADLLTLVTVAADYVTGKGFGLISNYHHVCILTMLCCMFFTFVFLFCMFIGNITFVFFSRAAHKSDFRYILKCIKLQITRKRLPYEYMERVENFFDVMWTKCQGYPAYMGGSRKNNNFRLPKLFPRSLMMEICLDLSTGLFKHSIMFHEMDKSFLANLSMYISEEVYLEGYLIYQRNQLKDKLIYIFSGMVQILSEEDGETPLINLVDGTCLSESCLIIPYRSRNVVKCNTTCVLHILRREDFLKVARKYSQSQFLLNVVRKRYYETNRLHELKKLVNTSDELIPTKKSMFWLKYTLHKLMADNSHDCALRHTEPNVYIERVVDETKFKNWIFCPNYISMLVIAEVVQDTNDSLFVRSTFPHILKPDTGLVLFWDIAISLLAIIASTVIPYLTLTVKKYSTNIYVTIYLFNGIWLIDLIVQMRIAVLDNHRLLTQTFDILIFKIGTFQFLLDILALVPLEVLSGLIAKEQYVKYTYLNRIFKLSRVFKLLGKWEERYNSNPLIVRLFCAIFILLYGIFITACIFYSISTLNGGGQEEFYKIMYYASQLLTRVTHAVTGYSMLKDYYLLNTLIFGAMCTLLYVLAGLIFSANAFNQMNHWNIQYRTNYLIRAMKHIDKRYENYICNVSHSKCLRDYGAPFTHPGYLYEKMPKEWIGFLFQYLFMDRLEKLPIFAGLSKMMLRDVLQNAAYVLHFAPSEVILHIGDLQNTIFIHLKGFLEITRSDGHCFIEESIKDLNSVEVFLQIPCRSSVMALTHCKAITVHYPSMRRVLMKYENFYEILRPLSGWRDIRNKILNLPSVIYTPDYLEDTQEMYRQSLIVFDRHNVKYLSAYPLKHLIWVFLPISIPPESTLLRYWEYQRCISAMFSALLFTTTSLCFYPLPHPIAFLKILVELSAACDLIVRCYVCYYNKEGILISHPKLTFMHYFKNGMLIDFLGVLPLHILIYKSTYIMLNINKLLQLHRYVSLVKLNTKTSMVPIRKIYMFWMLPLLIIGVNLLSSVLVARTCEETYQGYYYTLKCPGDSLLTLNTMPPITSPLQAHLYMLYVMVTLFSSITFQGFRIENHSEMFLIAVLCIISFCYDTIASAKAFGFFINEHAYLIAHDLQKQHFIKFLTVDNVKPLSNYFMRSALHHLNRMNNMEENNIHKHIESFTYNIQREVLYSRFGKILETCCLLGSEDIEPFLRNILINTEYQVFCEGGFVQTINDITQYTMIIVTGIVELCVDCYEDKTNNVYVTLGPGSIIGNISTLQYNRLEMSCIALGNMELLFVKTKVFHEVLQHFPKSKEVFEDLKAIHLNHVPGVSNFQYPDKEEFVKKWEFNKRSQWYYIVFIILNILGAYVAILSYFYTVAVSSEYHAYLDPILDICYLFAFGMMFVMPITDRMGVLLKISTNYFHKGGFTICIIAAVPIQLIINFLPYNKLILYYLYVGARANVMLRAYFFFYNWNFALPRSRTAMFTMKFILYLIVLILIVFSVTALLMFCTVFDNDNFNIPIIRHELVYGTWRTRVKHFIVCLYVVTNMFTHTAQDRYYPHSWLFVILLIILMSLWMGYLSVFYTMIISMIRATRQTKLAYLDDVKYMFSLMEHNDISGILLERSINYCGSIWRAKTGNKTPHILDQLPEYLKNPIYADIYMNMIEKNSVFQTCHYDLKRQLHSKLKLDHYYYGDYVVCMGTIDNTMYWVLEGRVVAITATNSILQIYKPGDNFGIVQGLHPNSPHPYNYRIVVQSAIILSLKKCDWDYMLLFFPASKNIIQSRANECDKADRKLRIESAVSNSE